MRLLLLVVLAVSHIVYASNPILFVPGWGPPAFTKLNRLVGYFEADGYSPSRLHVFSYPYKETLDDIQAALIPQLKRVMAKYPSNTKFDVVTHSLGHFVALQSLLEGGMGDRIDHYIGLAGIGMGQYALPKGCGVASCVAIEPLTPFPSPYAVALLERYSEVVKSWHKCSLFSEDDNVLFNPYDASRFPDGINVKLSGYLHNDFIKKRAIYEILRDRCGI